MNKLEVLKEKYYPDNSQDGTSTFYNWLRQYAASDFSVLNIGAGFSSKERIRSLRGEVKHVVGADIDEAVLSNQDLDEAVVIKNERLPFSDNSFDLAWADYVMEHVEHPTAFLKEVYRVLRPGASFFFRTPNKYHYVSLVSWMTPFSFHKLVANRARDIPAGGHEPYPTFYRFNSRKDVIQGMSAAGFGRVEMEFIEAEPSYLAFNPVAFRLGVSYERLLNRYKCLHPFRSNIYGRLQK